MIITLGICLVYTCACVALGAALLPALGVPQFKWTHVSVAVLLATSLLLGQGVLAAVWMIIGLAGKFVLPLIVVLLAVCLMIGANVFLRQIRPLSGRLWSQALHHLLGLPTPILMVAILSLTLVALLGVFNAILPVRFGAGDGIFFYMVLPKVMAASGRLVPVSGYEYTHGVSGFLGEMHHAALLALSGEQAALVFVWVTTLTMLTILVGICGHLGVGRTGKWFAVAMTLSSTTVSFYLIDGKVDLFATAMGLAALYWALHTKEREIQVGAACLAGLFTGFAVIAKATYVFAVALPVVTLIILSGILDVRRMALFGAFVAIPFLPHAVKNAILFEEPFAPFVFLDAQAGEAYRSQGYWNSPMVTRHILLTYPLALVYGTHSFQYGNISGLYLALGPLMFFVPTSRWRRYGDLLRFTAVVIGTVIVTALLQASYFAPRFSLPALLAMIPVIAFAAEHVFRASAEYLWFRAVIVACVIIALIGYSNLEQDFKRLVRYGIRGSSICDIEGFPLPECHDMLALNDLAAPGERILTSNSYSYWLRSDLIQCLSDGDDLGLLIGSEDKLERIYERGFRYVENIGEEWDLKRVPEGILVSLAYRRAGADFNNAVQIYEIQTDDRNRHPGASCSQGTTGAWEVMKVK